MSDASLMAAGVVERQPTAWNGVVAVYLSGLLQGLTLVSFPASSGALATRLGLWRLLVAALLANAMGGNGGPRACACVVACLAAPAGVH